MGVATSWFLLLGAILFTIGAVGVLLKRNVLVVLMCVELMMSAVNLTFVALARQLSSLTGQIFVFIAMVVAAVEVAVGLAIVVELNRLRETAPLRRQGTTADVDDASEPTR